MEISNEEYLKELEEEGSRGRKAFRAGYCRGLFIVAVLVAKVRKRELEIGEKEKQDFFFGESCGVISFWIALLVGIWIFVGG